MEEIKIMSNFFTSHESINLIEINSDFDNRFTKILMCYENMHKYHDINEIILSEINIIYQILAHFYEHFKCIFLFRTLDSNSKIIYQSNWLSNEDDIETCLENFQWMLFSENFNTMEIAHWLRINKKTIEIFLGK